MLPVSAGQWAVHNKPPLFVQHTDSSFIPYSGPPVPYIGQDKRPFILIPTPLTLRLFTNFCALSQSVIAKSQLPVIVSNWIFCGKVGELV